MFWIEHFGIVPLEAMACCTAVIAVASGGPLETVVHGKTGMLCDQTPESFGRAILQFIEDPDLAIAMGKNASEHVKTNFSRKSMDLKLAELMTLVVDRKRTQVYGFFTRLVFLLALMFTGVCTAIAFCLL